jgi:hypothetical protein
MSCQKYINCNGSFVSYRPATPEPEDLEDEGETDEEEDVVFPTEERQREDAKSQSNPVEYVTIRRTRPVSSTDAVTTTPR